MKREPILQELILIKSLIKELQTNSKDMLTTNQAAEYLNISKSTLYKMTHENIYA